MSFSICKGTEKNGIAKQNNINVGIEIIYFP